MQCKNEEIIHKTKKSIKWNIIYKNGILKTQDDKNITVKRSNVKNILVIP